MEVIEKQEYKSVKIVKTDTVKVKYARMPIVDLTQRFLVEILEPVQLVPSIKELRPAFRSDKMDLDDLKDVLLDEWHDQFKSKRRKLKGTDDEWMLNVDKVELIECDILTPKK